MKTKTIKICHMTSAHERYDSRIFEKECSSLAKNGFNVYLVVNDAIPDENINDVKILSTGHKYVSRKERIITGTRDVYVLASSLDADIYHIHDPELLPYGMKLKKKGKYVVFDSHERYVQQIMIKDYINFFIRRMVAGIYQKYETYVCKRIDGVVIPGERTDSTSFENRSKRCVIVRNAPILEENGIADVKKNISNHILFQPGLLSKERGIVEMVVASYRTNSKALLAGPISDEFKKELFEKKEACCIDYKGSVRHSEVVKYMKQASIGIAVMHNVGQYGGMSAPPTKVLEFAYMGLPIIGSNTPPALRDFLELNKCGIAINSDKIDEFVEAINYLYDHPDDAVEMGLRGRQAVERDWNWQDDVMRLTHLYQEILE